MVKESIFIVVLFAKHRIGGARYEGEWKQDLQHGQGVEVWPDGAKYEVSLNIKNRADTRTARNTAREYLPSLMEATIKATLLRTRLLAMANIIGRTENLTKDNGTTAK